MGKGIGNGYPVSVTAFAPVVVRDLGGEPVMFAQSHQNDPLGAAVAREVIGVIDTGGWIEHSREVAGILMNGLEAIKARSNRIQEIRGRGLMVAVELRDDADASVTTRVHQDLVDRGYVLARRPGMNVLRLDPALTIERIDIEGFLVAFEDVLAG
jgi:acetylornithine aminotransferase